VGQCDAGGRAGADVAELGRAASRAGFQPPEATVSSITAAEALHQLYMYKRRMTGFGKRQGGPYKVASNTEIIAALEKRLRQFGVKV
jgi:hypothetical protein